MLQTTTYLIFWQPDGTSIADAAKQLDEQFLSDLGGSYYAQLGEYYQLDANGQQQTITPVTHFGGAVTATDAYPHAGTTGDPVSQDDIAGEVQKVSNAHPEWNAPGFSTLYEVVLGEGIEFCNAQGACSFPVSGKETLCAYHGSFDVNGTTAVFAMDGNQANRFGCGQQYPTPNDSQAQQDASADADVTEMSHETFEAITDPTLSSWWVDSGAFHGQENGDLCNQRMGPTAADGSDITLNGHPYAVQSEWSNAAATSTPFSGCIISSDAIQGASDYPACTANTLPPNDDGSSDQVTLPFPVNFFNQTFPSAWVNNNGNLTFDGPQWTYTPYGLQSTAHEIIAPFFADVDTRAANSGQVTYGGAAAHDGKPAYFCVDWTNVGYYGEHNDRLNSFQLLLIDRSAQTRVSGDFDIVFNYGKIQWETGDASYGSGGLGGESAAAGYSNGSTASLQVLGSLEPGALLDDGPDSLIQGSRNSATKGRYVFAVRNGGGPIGGTIHGTVTTDLGNLVSGAPVQACTGTLGVPEGQPSTCYLTQSNDSGTYSFTGLPSDLYNVTVNPPSTSALYPAPAFGEVYLLDGDNATVDLPLEGDLYALPLGMTLSYHRLNALGEPVIDQGVTTPVRDLGCASGSATATVVAANGSGTVTINLHPDGGSAFAGTLPDLSPLHGAATLSVKFTCPSSIDNFTDTVSIYIDPSGIVVDTAGNPVDGATVTLLRADTSDGPFTAVPDGSALMSPGNRANPDLTTPDGRFGWDVLTGYYQVQASKDGCTNPNDPTSSTVTSAVFAVPPPVTNLTLTLNCPQGDLTPPTLTTTPVTIEGNTTGGYSGPLPGVSVSDPDDAPSTISLQSDAPALLPLGVTTVTWQAHDPAGNHATPQAQQVTVTDTTPPTLTCPADITATYLARPALGTAHASDIVDASPQITNDAPSTFGLGDTLVTWTATDASGNRSSCQQHVSLHLPITSVVSSGDSHTLALLTDGTVLAWGGGGNGQLGTGTTTDTATPARVPGLSSITSVCAGGLFSMALRSDGTVWAWGDNSQGELGDGTTASHPTPVRVTGLPSMYAIACGRYHALAVGIDGSVWAWGANTFGQDGQSPSTTITRPTRVDGADNVIAVAAGMYHSLALRSDGTVLAWGADYDGQLGDGSASTSRSKPVTVAGLSGITAIAAGWLHSLATGHGHVYAWGSNASGQLGDGSTTDRLAPVSVPGIGSARALAGGADFSLATDTGGTTRAWGGNRRGQLGDGTTTDRHSPVIVAGLTGATALAAGAAQSVVAMSSGAAESWGYNQRGQLGDGTTTSRRSPVTVTGVNNVASPTP